MKTDKINGQEVLIISREQIEKNILQHWQNEKRANDFLKAELAKFPNDNAMILAYAHQEIKARGFKEAWEELLFPFTGKICNIDENGKICTDRNSAASAANQSVIDAATKCARDAI